MVRATIFALTVLCFMTPALPAAAIELAASAMPNAVVPSPTQAPSPDAARMLALEIAARAQGDNVHGRFTPSTPRAPMFTPSAAPTAPATMPAAACGNVTAVPSGAPAGITTGGMRFMPLHRATETRTFAVPARKEVVVTAQALRAAVAGSKNESDLAQVALQNANEPSAHSQAMTELASLTGGASGVAPSTDPTAMTNQAVLREIQRYRNSHGTW